MKFFVLNILVLLIFGTFSFAGGFVLLVDDFKDKKPENSLNLGVGTWFSEPSEEGKGIEMIFDNINKIGETGYCLKLKYDIEPGKTYHQQGYSSENISGLRHKYLVGGCYFRVEKNLKPYKYLILSIKGDAEDGYSMVLPLELKDDKRGGRYVIEGITKQWQRIAIPLKGFREISNWNNIQEIMFLFDDSLTRKKGSIYLDDIYFAKSKEIISSPVIKPVFVNAPLTFKDPKSRWMTLKPGSAKLSRDASREYGAIDSGKDLSCTVYTSWDSKYLYILAEVFDSEIAVTKSKDYLEEGDGIALYIDAENNGFKWGGDDDVHLLFIPDGTVWALPEGYQPLVDEVSQESVITRKGYIIKAVISWSFLKVIPEPGKELGFSVSVQDLDLEEKTKRARESWYYVPGKQGIELGKMLLNKDL